MPSRSLSARKKNTPADGVAQPGAGGVRAAGARPAARRSGRRPRARTRRDRRLSQVAPESRVSTPASSFSQIRGTPNRMVGCTSRRFCGHGLDRLREVDLGAGGGVEPGAEDPLGDVATAAGRTAVRSRGPGGGSVNAPSSIEHLDRELDVGDREHRALGRAGRARGVDQGGEVVGLLARPAPRPARRGAPRGARVPASRNSSQDISARGRSGAGSRAAPGRRSARRSGQSSSTARALSTCSWSSATSTLAPESSRR